MLVEKRLAWIDYINEDAIKDAKFDINKSGKWMYFFDNRSFVEKICERAVKNRIVDVAKHSNSNDGVACFYLNYDDIVGHKKVISYFLENNLIQKTKTGRLYNISFKLDTQTLAGEYGNDFRPQIKLSDFIDLDTGQWLV